MNSEVVEGTIHQLKYICSCSMIFSDSNDQFYIGDKPKTSEWMNKWMNGKAWTEKHFERVQSY